MTLKLGSASKRPLSSQPVEIRFESAIAEICHTRCGIHYLTDPTTERHIFHRYMKAHETGRNFAHSLKLYGCGQVCNSMQWECNFVHPLSSFQLILLKQTVHDLHSVFLPTIQALQSG